eukprot:CAMPEP_0202885494 /NCGR_PEP_ID=MMETSP1391-20130828/41692_1 /ASSEMBLY_ACC=CAM_ASM_000867 /TAXON_ID=1034604 /ORGANISM="Chlamydomonas leiostraca, Strain SAG 11-49" /LENGTH=248 /DNA_ID=CAMNT_0049568745 /DNA_START=100 /DNA_END=846 /DNA_ORIENTATION=+
MMDVNQAGTGVGNWWKGLPPITRWMATSMLVLTVAGNFGWISPMYLVLFWKPILKKFEVWRLITNFMFLGRLSINFVVRMLWVIQYGVPLENQVFQFEPSDYLFMLLFNGALCLAAAPFLGFVMNGVPLIMSMIYVYSRNFPDQVVKLYGMVAIQTFYLPFAFACISVLLGQSIIPDLTGIAVGHVYYFLHDVYPRTAGRMPLKTPGLLRQWCADWGLRGAAPPPRETQGAPQGFQAFRGPGRRLGQD